MNNYCFSDSPVLGISMVTFILHNVSWQQCTSVSTDWEFLQRTATSSLPTMHPFCWRAVPFSTDKEEKHCRPKQRWTPMHENPSHTHSISPVLPLSAENTHKKKILFPSMRCIAKTHRYASFFNYGTFMPACPLYLNGSCSADTRLFGSMQFMMCYHLS